MLRYPSAPQDFRYNTPLLQNCIKSVNCQNLQQTHGLKCHKAAAEALALVLMFEVAKKTSKSNCMSVEQTLTQWWLVVGRRTINNIVKEFVGRIGNATTTSNNNPECWNGNISHLTRDCKLIAGRRTHKFLFYWLTSSLVLTGVSFPLKLFFKMEVAQSQIKLV